MSSKYKHYFHINYYLFLSQKRFVLIIKKIYGKSMCLPLVT